MVTLRERCFKTDKEQVTEIIELRTSHEETDTRMMLQAKFETVTSQKVKTFQSTEITSSYSLALT